MTPLIPREAHLSAAHVFATIVRNMCKTEGRPGLATYLGLRICMILRNSNEPPHQAFLNFLVHRDEKNTRIFLMELPTDKTCFDVNHEHWKLLCDHEYLWPTTGFLDPITTAIITLERTFLGLATGQACFETTSDLLPFTGNLVEVDIRELPEAKTETGRWYVACKPIPTDEPIAA